jgi:hypothetical protein
MSGPRMASRLVGLRAGLESAKKKKSLSVPEIECQLLGRPPIAKLMCVFVCLGRKKQIRGNIK